MAFMEEEDLLMGSQYNGIPRDSCLLELRLHWGRVKNKDRCLQRKMTYYKESNITYVVLEGNCGLHCCGYKRAGLVMVVFWHIGN